MTNDKTANDLPGNLPNCNLSANTPNINNNLVSTSALFNYTYQQSQNNANKNQNSNQITIKNENLNQNLNINQAHHQSNTMSTDTMNMMDLNQQTDNLIHPNLESNIQLINQQNSNLSSLIKMDLVGNKDHSKENLNVSLIKENLNVQLIEEELKTGKVSKIFQSIKIKYNSILSIY